MVIREDPIIQRELSSPRQFHLPDPNTAVPIIISRASKLDVLRFVWVLEPELRSLVKAGDDVVQVVKED